MSTHQATAGTTARTKQAVTLLAVVIPMAIAVGTAVAFFLWSLESATRFRQAHPWLLWLLPLAGAFIGIVYARWGHNSDIGTRLILDEIHQPGGGIPARMAPLVLMGTIITHLFGGSAGREGTAVQMGGSLASAFERKFLRRVLPPVADLVHGHRRQLLQAGMAAGFGAVFGTPLAGAVFALEVLRFRTVSAAAIVPCLLAAYVGDWSVARWGVTHTRYPQIVLDQLGLAHLDGWMLAKVAAAAVCFGVASKLFLESAHGVTALVKRFIAVSWLRPVAGGAAVIVLTLLVGSSDYLGLGVTSPNGGVSIVASFSEHGAHPFSWLFKLVFTAVTVGSGFKGGEVTPLFFIGASLGNIVASVLHAPVPLFAALGFVAVFGAAANTPLACAVMGLELFGGDAAFYFAVACLLAFVISGRKGLYHAHPHPHPHPPPPVAGNGPEAETPLQPTG